MLIFLLDPEVNGFLDVVAVQWPVVTTFIRRNKMFMLMISSSHQESSEGHFYVC